MPGTNVIIGVLSELIHLKYFIISEKNKYFNFSIIQDGVIN